VLCAFSRVLVALFDLLVTLPTAWYNHFSGDAGGNFGSIRIYLIIGDNIIKNRSPEILLFL
jgi:hypothetical protein